VGPAGLVNTPQGCTEMKFEDSLRLYQRIEQLLKRDLAFVKHNKTDYCYPLGAESLS
jgi:hypothetical protein